MEKIRFQPSPSSLAMDDCNLSLIIRAQTVNISLQDALALEIMERLIFL